MAQEKEENLLNFSRFFNFQFFASFQSHFTAASLHPTRLVAANKKKSSSASSLCCHFPQVKRRKKARCFFSLHPFCRWLMCARLSFLFHFSFTSIQFAEEEEQWRDEKMMGEEERKKERKKYEKKMKIVLEDFSLLFCISN